MIRAKVIENHSIIAEGVLDSSTDVLTINIEGMGDVSLQKLLQGFNKKDVRLTVRLSEEVKKAE